MFMWMSVLFVHQTHGWDLWMPEEGVVSPGTEVKVSCELCVGIWTCWVICSAQQQISLKTSSWLTSNKQTNKQPSTLSNVHKERDWFLSLVPLSEAEVEVAAGVSLWEHTSTFQCAYIPPTCFFLYTSYRRMLYTPLTPIIPQYFLLR